MNRPLAVRLANEVAFLDFNVSRFWVERLFDRLLVRFFVVRFFVCFFAAIASSSATRRERIVTVRVPFASGRRG